VPASWSRESISLLFVTSRAKVVFDTTNIFELMNKCVVMHIYSTYIHAHTHTHTHTRKRAVCSHMNFLSSTEHGKSVADSLRGAGVLSHTFSVEFDEVLEFT
jgi:hypothetical protein